MNDAREPASIPRDPDPVAALEALRARIDGLDREILERLNDRARLVQGVGEWKRVHGAAVYSAAREREVVDKLVAANAGPFPSSAIPHVFREIISGCRSLEEPLRVGYFGAPGTNAHEAARRQFGSACELVPVDGIPALFAAVERGEIDLAVVPAENSTEGVVTQTYDCLADASITLSAEIVLRISHQLLSRATKLEDVRRVASHPQALAQCRGWLDARLPGVERAETPSTAAAAALAARDAQTAAIASAAAAEVHGLRALATSIEDRRDNTTRFLVLGRDAPAPSGRDLTCAVFTVRRDASGALLRLLEPFADEGVSLSAIQARPMKGKPFEYLFFLDLEGHRLDPPVARALDEAARRSLSHRVLGSFPRAREGGGAA